MSLEIAPHIVIPPGYRIVYRVGRFVLYSIFLFLSGLLFMKVVFPDIYATFDFSRYDHPKNSIIEPKIRESQEQSDGILQKNQVLIGAITAEGDFKNIYADFSSLDEREIQGEFSLVRMYRAMTYPDGPSAIFFDGTLLLYENNHYIISKELARFIPKDTLEALDFSEEQFLPVGKEEFLLHPLGDPIQKDEYWIEGSLFFRDGTYYQITEGRADYFVSKNAFLSKYDEKYVRRTNRDFPDHEISEVVGFADGVLMDYQGGVYVSSEGKARPIDSPQSFLSKGYTWEDVIPVTEEEFLAYAQGETYNARRVHVDGTVFVDTTSEETFFVENGKKRRISGDNIYSQFKNLPLVVIDAHPETVRCIVQEDVIGYGCVLQAPHDGRGVEYQFSFIPSSNGALSSMSLVFDKEINKENLSMFLSNLRSRIMKRFGL